MVDFPMPIDPVSPIISIGQARRTSIWSSRKKIPATQLLQQRNERQSKDGEIIAFDPLEQLYTQSFDLISPDRRQNGIARLGQITAKEGRGEGPHCQASRFRRRPDHLAAFCEGD